MSGTGRDPVDNLLAALFGDGHDCRREGPLIAGTGRLDGAHVAVVGTVERAPIGARLALALARRVLDVMRDAPGRPILLVVDNGGQRLARWDELVCNSGYVAHLGKVLDLARRRGHRVVGIVVDLAVSAGFMATGMAADRCHAVAGAELRLMAPSAMSRVMRIPEERLRDLFATSPALGPGAENFLRIGALESLVAANARRVIADSLSADAPPDDARRRLGQARGGRLAAAEVAALVRAGSEG